MKSPNTFSVVLLVIMIAGGLAILNGLHEAEKKLEVERTEHRKRELELVKKRYSDKKLIMSLFLELQNCKGNKNDSTK